jgi:hypothetical protein
MLSAEQFVGQPLAVIVAAAATGAPGITHPIIQVEEHNFRTTCSSFTCDLAY